MEGSVEKIKFSVIIPTFNAVPTICRAVDSVLAQSYSRFELIVVDDASTDGTTDLIEKTYPGKLTLIKKVINSGSSVARNSGMDVATGQYIAFLDADDVWHRDKLALLAELLAAHPAIHLFYHPYTLEDISGKSLPGKLTIYRLPFVKLLPANLIATSCAVIRNDQKFRFDPKMRYTEDFDLWLRIGYKYKIHFIDIPLTRIFRPFTTSGGISSNRWKMRKGEMRAYRKLVILNPLFIFLLPGLMITSLGKHFVKLLWPARTKRPPR